MNHPRLFHFVGAATFVTRLLSAPLYWIINGRFQGRRAPLTASSLPTEHLEIISPSSPSTAHSLAV